VQKNIAQAGLVAASWWMVQRAKCPEAENYLRLKQLLLPVKVPRLLLVYVNGCYGPAV